MIELAITDKTPEQPPAGLSETDILDCFNEASALEGQRNYLVAVGRLIEAKVIAAHPSAAPLCTAEDANNYCRILTLLGMEEEGDPVAEVERLVSSAAPQVPSDAKRMDWLDARGDTLIDCFMRDGKLTYILRHPWGAPIAHGNSVRAAIDAAMNAGLTIPAKEPTSLLRQCHLSGQMSAAQSVAHHPV